MFKCQKNIYKANLMFAVNVVVKCHFKGYINQLRNAQRSILLCNGSLYAQKC